MAADEEEGAADRRGRFLPWMVACAVLALWAVCSGVGLLPETIFPRPQDVGKAFLEEAGSGRLTDDIIASLFRVGIGFTLAALVGIPLGLLLGLRFRVRVALLPLVNFSRALSPLAWIPFAIFWFGIGDAPAIFLIFMSVVFPLTLATLAAVSQVPQVYFRVARDYGLSGTALLTQVTLPAIMPEVITALRVTAGLAWLVVVAAEMIAGRDGLGYLIWDARNGLRMDLLVLGMIVIGVIGMALDRLLVQLTRVPSVRWGYEA